MHKDLRRLGEVRAPAGFAARVLRSVGLGDRFAPLESPLGRVYVAWNSHGISAVIRAAGEAGFKREFEALNGRSVERSREIPPALARALESGSAAEARRLTYDLRSCTPFEVAVLRKALEIPRGQVRPYNWIAREIGRPKAMRAVGTALANNPVPILIPCHRVVRGDGKIGNYGLGGPQKKTRILEAEGVDVSALGDYGRGGMRFKGVSSTKIFCWPTCGAGRRAKEENVRPFRTERAARAAGYRPCKLCRPAA
jgi:O-6-methylguanine DNA methyltransferase